MRRLVIGDRKLRVRDEGEGRKTPVVLVHGAGASSVTWIDVLRRLSVRRRTIAPDLPGHGQSDPWHTPTVDMYRDAVGTVCANLGVGRAILVGHSMGGAIALRTALGFPDKVAGIVIVGIGARIKVPPALHAVVERDFGSFPELVAKGSYSPSTAREIVERWQAVLVQAPQEIVAADFHAIDGFDLRERLPEIKTPALVIGGEDDLFAPPKFVRELGAGLPNARTVMLPHAGHNLHHEQLEHFHAALDPFLAECP
jgi:pimeloyl-ACP methyl ester carboxylesterase